MAERIKEDKDLSEVFKENENPFYHWLNNTVEETHQTAKEKFIPIPKLKITDEGVVEYGFVDFDLDLSEFNHAPIKNDLLIQNLENLSDLQRINGDAIDFAGYNPKKSFLKFYELSLKLIMKSAPLCYLSLYHRLLIIIKINMILI